MEAQYREKFIFSCQQCTLAKTANQHQNQRKVTHKAIFKYLRAMLNMQYLRVWKPHLFQNWRAVFKHLRIICHLLIFHAFYVPILCRPVLDHMQSKLHAHHQHCDKEQSMGPIQWKPRWTVREPLSDHLPKARRERVSLRSREQGWNKRHAADLRCCHFNIYVFPPFNLTLARLSYK